jgi:hypothetical protein
MFAPAVTVRDEFHGPLDEVPTCFNKLMAGVGSFTSTSAVEVLPVPPLVELTVTELLLRPVLVPFTLTDKVQDELAERVTLFKLTVAVPEVAVAVPPQVFDKPFGLATSRPLGRASLKFTPVKDEPVFGLVIVKLSVVVLFVKIGFAVNDLAITGGSITVRLAWP